MKYSTDEAIEKIVRRGSMIRNERYHRRVVALSSLSAALLTALICVIIFLPGRRLATPGATVTPGAGSPTAEAATPTPDTYAPTGAVGKPGGPIVDPVPEVEKEWIDMPWQIEATASSVLKLEVYDASGARIGTGSGFVFYDSKYVVTAYHVIANMDHMIATTDYGATLEIRDVLMGDSENDFAICRFAKDPEIEPLKMMTVNLARGAKTVAIGSQFGVVNMVTVGNLCGIWSNDTTMRYLFTSPVSSGSSGGPLLNSRGEVIGMVSGTYDEGQNLNVAVPITLIYNRMKEELEGDAQ
ncbi:MAG: trypsin-like peptidase domain-containing protein [Lachnospiraceae bacterium]|nr:trypsin-like peptidase domain-containing protein [Lachnospiraceae bacterium]